ncbi:MAG: TetR/AcrR family transcriptional regulator [Sedimentisphaerales bacterium]|nr:TetR/AcrR family transcriptional regulator [Sedimentisphaerales bacterium]
MGKTTLTRKEREKLRHKKEILSAALKLFSERGFHNVSMQQIAEASEFAVGSLYNFFASKEALFEELANNCGEEITSTLIIILDGPGTELERLTNFIRYAPVLLEEHAAFMRLYVSELGTRGVKLSKRQEKEDLVAAVNTRLEQLLANGIRKGVFRCVDPAITTKAINSTLETLAFENAGHFDKVAVTEMFEKVERLFIDGLLVPEGQDNE